MEELPFTNTGSREILPLPPKIQAIKERYFELLLGLSSLDSDRANNEMVLFCEKLRSKYPNFKDYLYYHAPIGSGVYKGTKVTEEDFPGEDSMELFINNLIEKYTKK